MDELNLERWVARLSQFEGKNLSASEEQELDALLESQATSLAARSVRALPEAQPSLVWRSRLNEALVERARRERTRARLDWVLRPVAGLAIAGAFALVMIMRPAEMPSRGASIGERLVSAHQETVSRYMVAAYGPVFQVTTQNPEQRQEDSWKWEESDLSAL
jgi:hypothetical protein